MLARTDGQPEELIQELCVLCCKLVLTNQQHRIVVTARYCGIETAWRIKLEKEELAVLRLRAGTPFPQYELFTAYRSKGDCKYNIIKSDDYDYIECGVLLNTLRKSFVLDALADL